MKTTPLPITHAMAEIQRLVNHQPPEQALATLDEIVGIALDGLATTKRQCRHEDVSADDESVVCNDCGLVGSVAWPFKRDDPETELADQVGVVRLNAQREPFTRSQVQRWLGRNADTPMPRTGAQRLLDGWLRDGAIEMVRPPAGSVGAQYEIVWEPA